MIVIKNKEQEQIELDYSGSAIDLLNKLDINPETIIVAVNDTIVGNDYTISNTDTVTLYSVISGG